MPAFSPTPPTDPQIESHLLSELPLSSHTLLFGLNYKHTLLDKKGIINSIKGKKQAIDIDLSCILFDKTLKVVDVVWFKQLRDESEALRHHGDSLNGKDRGDTAQLDPNVDVETIELRLDKLPLNVSHIVLLVSVFNGYPLNNVERGSLYISDDEANEVLNLDLTLLEDDINAICVASLSRELDEWRLTLNNLTLNDNKMSNIIIQMQEELGRLYNPLA